MPPSLDPMLIKHDISDKNHEWGEIIPKIYPQEGPWDYPLHAGTFTCKNCGIQTFSLTNKDESGKEISGININAKYILIWSTAPESVSRLKDWACDELSEPKRWLADIDEEERKHEESLEFLNHMYANGAYKVSKFNNRVSFVGTSIAAYNIKRIGIKNIRERF